MRYQSAFLWTLSGKMFYLGSQFLLVVFLSKLGTPIELGNYSLGLAVSAPVFLFGNMHFRILLASESKKNENFSYYLVLRILLSITALPVIYFVCYLMDLESEPTKIILLIGLLKVCDSFSDIYYGLFQKNHRMDLIAKSQIMRGVISLVLFSVTHLITNDISTSLLTMVVSWLAIVIFFDKYQSTIFLPAKSPRNQIDNCFWTSGWLKEEKNKNKIHTLNRLLKNGFPLGLVAMMGSLVANIPNYVIEWKLSLVEVGIFASILYLIQSSSTFMSALWEPAIPKLSTLRDSKDVRGFSRLVIVLSLIGLAIGLIGVVISWYFGDVILVLIFNENFREYDFILVILSVVMTIRYLGGVWSVSCTVLRLYWIQVPVNVLNLLIVFSLCAYLVEVSGLVGVAYGVLISAIFTRSVFLVFMIRGIRRIPLNG